MTTSDVFHDMIPPEHRTQTPVKAEAFTRMQCDWYNQSEGKLTWLDCQECKNRGYFQILNADGNAVLRECKCMARRRYIKSMRSSGLGEVYQTCTFEAYRTDTDWQKTCKALAMQYARRTDNAWLLFAGQSGVGKTHLCTAICSELAKAGRSICYKKWIDIFGKIDRTKYDESGRSAIMKEIKAADVLYIDDFLKTAKNKAPSQQAVEYALEIVDIRYMDDKRTMFSTEFMDTDLLAFDEALGGRIAEKSKGCKIQVLRGEGRNFRLK